MTDLSGRLLAWSLDTDRDYLHFFWAEDLSDFWVMDVVTEAE